MSKAELAALLQYAYKVTPCSAAVQLQRKDQRAGPMDLTLDLTLMCFAGHEILLAMGKRCVRLN